MVSIQAIALLIAAFTTMDAAAAETDPQPASADPIAIEGAFTQFAGAAVTGDADGTLRYGGRVDAYVTVSGTAIGLGDRFAVNLHPEFRYGQSVNSAIGLLPMNTAMAFPSGEGADFDLSVNFTLKLGARSSVTFGKINLLNLVSRTPILGGGGVEGFQHIALAAPPSGLVPPSLLGALFTVPTKHAILGFWVYDPQSQSNTIGFKNPFSRGVTGLVSATVPIRLGGETGFQSFRVAVTSKTGVDLADVPQLILPPGTVIINEIKGGWTAAWSFQQFLWTNPQQPGQGFGLFGQLSASDGNPTPLDWSGLIGAAGNPFTTRPDDRVGIAYFQNSFSDTLAEAVAPVFALGNEQGVEAFYTAQLGRTFRLTASAQYIDPSRKDRASALVLGVRLKAGF